MNSPYCFICLDAGVLSILIIFKLLLSQPQLNHKSTQKLGWTRKWLYTTTTTTHHHPAPTTHRELNVSNISAVTNPIITDPIITRTSLSIMTITKTKAVAIATTTKPSQLDFHDVIFHDVIFQEVISYYNTIVDHICLWEQSIYQISASYLA